MPNLILCKPHPLPDCVSSAFKRWTETQESRLFTLLLTENLERRLIDQIWAERKCLHDVETLDLLVDSGGGDIEAAYQLITFLRHRCKKLRIFVPDWAKSAATLLALGADEIWMTETAELGPLDAQIPDPRVPEDYISALDEFRAIDYLRDHGYQIFDEFVRLLLKRTQFRLKDVLGHAIEYSSRTMAPLYEQVDPLYFGAAHRALEMSIFYGKRVMSRHAYSSWSEDKISDLLKTLTWGYPSHSFAIDYHEAKGLGLHVQLLDGEMADIAHEIAKNMKDCVGFIDAAQPAESSEAASAASAGG